MQFPTQQPTWLQGLGLPLPLSWGHQRHTGHLRGLWATGVGFVGLRGRILGLVRILIQEMSLRACVCVCMCVLVCVCEIEAKRV